MKKTITFERALLTSLPSFNDSRRFELSLLPIYENLSEFHKEFKDGKNTHITIIYDK